MITARPGNAQPNNSLNRSAKSTAFIREALLLLWFVTPG
jgi:hypothetical protein